MEKLEIKLEIGKEYITRSGLKAKVYDIAEHGERPVIAATFGENQVTAREYSVDGRYLPNKQSDLDIVGEWQEPLDFDWSCLPVWAKFIVMQKSGKWYWSDIRPVYVVNDFLAGYWSLYENLYGEIPTEHAPKNFQGDWKDSLFENPNIKN